MLSGMSSSRDSAPDLGRVSAGREYFRTTSGRMLQKIKRHLPGTTVRPASQRGPWPAVQLRSASAWRECMGSAILSKQTCRRTCLPVCFLAPRGGPAHASAAQEPACGALACEGGSTMRATCGRTSSSACRARPGPLAGHRARPRAGVHEQVRRHRVRRHRRRHPRGRGGDGAGEPRGSFGGRGGDGAGEPRGSFGQLGTWPVSMMSCRKAQRRPPLCAGSCARGLMGCCPGSRGTVCMLSCCSQPVDP